MKLAGVATCGAALVLGTGVAAGQPARVQDSVAVTLSTTRAGARSVTVTVSLRTELQCGRLVGGSLVLGLPAEEQVPRTIAAAAVRVGRQASGAVSVRGHALTVTVPRATGVLCDVIGPGRVDVVLTRTANVGNPGRRARYAITVRRGQLLLKATFTIR